MVYWLYRVLTKQALDPAAPDGTAEARYADTSEVSVAVRVEDVNVVGVVPSEVTIVVEEKASGFTDAELATTPGRPVSEIELDVVSVADAVPVVPLVEGVEVVLYVRLTP